MKVFLCGLLLLAAEISEAGLEKYSSLVVADKNPEAPAPSNAKSPKALTLRAGAQQRNWCRPT